MNEICVRDPSRRFLLRTRPWHEKTINMTVMKIVPEHVLDSCCS